MNQKFSNLQLEVFDKHIMEIMLNRPKRCNALSLESLQELETVFSGIDNDVHAIVLSASGDVFCAGGDLTELGGGEESDVQFDNAVEKVVDAIKNASVPVIAAVEGACIGAGVDIMLACDLCVIAKKAYLQVPAVRLGLLYSPTGIKRMHRRVGSSVLKRLLLLGDKLDAEYTVSAGAASHLADRGKARADALQLASQVSEGIPGAVTASKRYLVALDNDVVDDDEWEALRRRLLASTERQNAVKDRRSSLESEKD
jgi:enoyl-CoA hydratase/carnithine racemase